MKFAATYNNAALSMFDFSDKKTVSPFQEKDQRFNDRDFSPHPLI